MKNKKDLIKTIITFIVTFALFKCMSIPAIDNLFPKNQIHNMFHAELVFVILTIIAAIVTKNISSLKFTKKKFLSGIFLGWWFLLYSLFAFLAKAGTDSIKVTVPKSDIWLLLLTSLLIGVAEETLTRGILQNDISSYIGKKSPRSIRLAVIIAGTIFGLAHLTNVFSGISFSSSLAQGIGNIASGILFGAIYVRSKNLWSCIIVHGIYDFLGFVSSGVLSGTSLTSSLVTFNPYIFVLMAIELSIAFILMRNKKLIPLIEKE